jgi:hypothetical protein
MIPELRAQIERCSGDRESLRRVQALLPADDGELDRLIEEALAGARSMRLASSYSALWQRIARSTRDIFRRQLVCLDGHGVFNNWCRHTALVFDYAPPRIPRRLHGTEGRRLVFRVSSASFTGLPSGKHSKPGHGIN